MQLAINVQIPVKLGGVGGHAIYIDTEGSFMLERALQMTKASIDELVLASSLSSPMDDDLIQQLDIDTYLSHIYLVRVHDPTEQLAVINNLPNLLKEHNQVYTCTQKLQILSDMQTKVVMFLTILSE
jgi:RAD51-like protein 2